MQEQRERFHILAVNALFALVDEHIQRADHGAALANNRKLLSLEPWSEPVHRQQMLLLARRGERSAALAQFETCRDILAAEFGVEPLAETIALYEQIRAGEIGVAQGELPVVEVTGRSAKNDQNISQVDIHDPPIVVNERDLPRRTKLFGRQEELERLQKWVGEDGCRLVGIFGMGGQGKSALAADLVYALAETSPVGGSPGMRFRHIIWKSLLNAPPLAEVMQEWLHILSDQAVTSLPASLDAQINQLLRYLQNRPFCSF